MNGEEPNTPIATPKPRKRPLPLRLVRWVVWLFAGCIILVLALLAFTETGMFRTMLRDTLNEELTSLVNGEVRIGEIHGNLFTGWRFDSISVRDDYGPVLSAQSVVVRYNPFRLFWKNIIVSELTLVNPKIFITRGAGRDWNINTLFKPVEDTTEAGKLDWTIDVNNLRIIDGVLVRYDSSVIGPFPTHTLDTEHLIIEGMNVAMAARYTPETMNLSIFQFRFDNISGDLDLRNISGDVTVTEEGTAVKTFSMATTRSSFQLDVAAEGFDPTAIADTFDLFKLPFALKLDSPVIDSRDLQYFLPSLDFLGGTYSLDLGAEGTLKDLALHTLDMETEGVHIRFAGTLKNIDQGSKMFIDVASDHLLITGSRAPEVLPGIPLPDYNKVGELRFSRLMFKGEPLKFHTEFDFTSGAGNASGYADLDITGEQLVYDTELKTTSIDLSKIFNNEDLSSSFSGKVSVSGAGTSLGQMNSTVDLKLDTSRFNQYHISHLTSYVAVGPSLLQMRTQISGKGGSMQITGNMTFEQDSVTGVELEAFAKELNLASFFPGQDMDSELTFDLRLDANTIDVNRSSGTMHVNISPSRFGDIKIKKDTLLLTLDQTVKNEREIRLASSYADISLKGEFNIPRFIDYLQVQTDSLGAALKQFNLAAAPATVAPNRPSKAAARRARTIASRNNERMKGAAPPPPVDSSDYMNAVYTVTLKEPERLASYFNATMVNVRGSFNGTIKGGPRGFHIGGDIKVTDFYYTDSLRVWKLAGLKCTYDIKNLQPKQPLKYLNAGLNLAIADLAIGPTYLKGIVVDLAYKDETPSFALRGGLDTTLQVGVRGTAVRRDTMYEVELAQLALNYRQQLWTNTAPVHFTIDTTRIVVTDLRMRHGAADLKIHGTRTFAGQNDFYLTMDDLKMGDLEYLLTADPLAMQDGGFTGTAVIEGNLKGTDARPIFAAGFYVDKLGYREKVFGKLMAEATYNNGQLDLYSEMDYLGGEGANNIMFISGSVPAAISLSGDPVKIDNKYANLKMKLNKFPLPLIEQFIGGMDHLEGTANADITISGTTRDPEFSGYLEIADGMGRLRFNNIRYRFSMRIEPEGRRFAIKQITIANREADWNEGKMEGSGYIDTKDLDLTGFQFDLRGKLVILRDESRLNLKYMTGNLYVGTGGGQISLSGRFDKPVFRGELIIMRGDLTLAPDRQVGALGADENVTYVVIDDVHKKKESSLFGQKEASPLDDLNETESSSSAFTSNISYDVYVSTGGRLHVVMPFSTLTQEELNAVLELHSFRVTNWGGESKFVGEVQVAEDSYYLFWGKRFRASGSLRFTNDLDNPDLNLRAVYSDDHLDPITKERRKVFVIMSIRGTKKQPDIKFSLTYDTENGPSVATGGDIKSDALSFVLLGRFSNELSQGEKGEIAGQISQSGMQIGSSLFSTAFSSLLSGSTPIERFEVQDLGSGRERISLSSSIVGFYVTANSQVNTVENSEFSVEKALGDKWFLGISRKATDRTQEAGTTLQSDVVYELKLLYRISF